MSGIKGTVYFKITRASGEVVKFSIDNTIQDGLLEAIRDRVKSNASVFSASYVPAKMVVDLSGSVAAKTISGSGFQSNTVLCGQSGTSYVNYVTYSNSTNIVFSDATGSETVASVKLQADNGTDIAIATSDGTGFAGEISSTFSSSDVLDVSYKIQFTHSNIAAHNDTLQTYRDKVLLNFTQGGSGNNIALTQGQLTVGDNAADRKATVPVALDNAGSGTGATKAITFSKVASSSAPTQFRMLNSDNVVGHVEAIGAGEYTSSTFTSDDNVSVTFTYSLSKSSG